MPHARSVIPSSPFNDILQAVFQCLLNYESSLFLVRRTDSSGLLVFKEDSNSEACCKISPAQFSICSSCHPDDKDPPKESLTRGLPNQLAQQAQSVPFRGQPYQRVPPPQGTSG